MTKKNKNLGLVWQNITPSNNKKIDTDKPYQWEEFSELLKNDEVHRKSFIKRYFEFIPEFKTQMLEKEAKIKYLQERINQTQEEITRLKSGLAFLYIEKTILQEERITGFLEKQKELKSIAKERF